MNGVMKELVSAQEQNKEHHLELEEKRMKMEQKLFEKEIEMQGESRISARNDANDEITGK